MKYNKYQQIKLNDKEYSIRFDNPKLINKTNKYYEIY